MMYLTLLSLIFPAVPYDTPPMVLWLKSYGGSANDVGHCVIETPDSGLLAAGWTSSFGSGGSDLWLLKTDPFGDTLWTKFYGGEADDFARTIFAASDSTYVLVGYTSSFGNGNDDVWVLKIHEDGDTLWTRTYGSPNADYGRAGCETIDSCYIICGTTSDSVTREGDVYILKIDRDGNPLWSKTYGDAEIPDQGRGVCMTSDEGYVIAGTTKPSTDRGVDIWMIKIDGEGDILWTKTFGGAEDDFSYGVEETSDGGFIVVGWTFSFGEGESDLYLVKTDEYGELEWQKTFGDDDLDEGYLIQETPDRGYIAGGYTFHMGAGNFDAYIVETDIYSDTTWTMAYGGFYNEYAYSISPTYDDGYIIVGSSSSSGAGGDDVWLAKLSWEESIAVKPDYRLSASRNHVGIHELDVLNYTQTDDVIEISCRASNVNWFHQITQSSGEPLDDADSDDSPDAGLVGAAGGFSRIHAIVEVPSDAEVESVDTLVVYGRSSNDEALIDSATIITVVRGEATLRIDPDQEGRVTPENSVIRYNLDVVSTMPSTQTGEITSRSTSGWTVKILKDGTARELEDTNENDTVDVGQLSPGAIKKIDVEIEMPAATPGLDAGLLDTLKGVAVAADTTILYVSTALDGIVRDSAVLVTSELPIPSIHNFPNPFETETRIVWSQPDDGEILIKLADRAGRPVTDIYEATCEAGIHSYLWHAQTTSGSALVPGVYVLILEFKPQIGPSRQILSKIVNTGIRSE